MKNFIVLLFAIIGVIILITFLGDMISDTNYNMYCITYTYEYDETDFTLNDYTINLFEHDFLMNDNLYVLDIYFVDLDIHYIIAQDRVLRAETNPTAIANYISGYNLHLVNDTMSITLTNTTFNSGNVIISAFYNEDRTTDYNMVVT